MTLHLCLSVALHQLRQPKDSVSHEARSRPRRPRRLKHLRLTERLDSDIGTSSSSSSRLRNAAEDRDSDRSRVSRLLQSVFHRARPQKAPRSHISQRSSVLFAIPTRAQHFNMGAGSSWRSGPARRFNGGLSRNVWRRPLSIRVARARRRSPGSTV